MSLAHRGKGEQAELNFVPLPLGSLNLKKNIISSFTAKAAAVAETVAGGRRKYVELNGHR